MRAQIAIATTVEKMLDLVNDTLVCREDLQQRLMSKGEETTRDAEASEKLTVELRDANLKLERVEN